MLSNTSYLLPIFVMKLKRWRLSNLIKITLVFFDDGLTYCSIVFPCDQLSDHFY